MKLKTLLIPIIAVSGIVFGCSEPKSEKQKEIEAIEKKKEANFPTIYVQYTIAEGSGENITKKDSMATISSEYIEVSLNSMTGGYFSAKYEVVKPASLVGFKYIFFKISDEQGNELRFQESTEFLNFMAEHGYGVVSQAKFELSTDYTFNRK